MESAACDLKLGQYRHFKGGLYFVVGVAKHVDLPIEFVVYRALYGDKSLFVRPKDEFVQPVTTNGRTVWRFTFVSDEEGQTSEMDSPIQREGAIP